MEIVKRKFEGPVYDVMEGCDRWEINVDGGHGICALVDVMPRFVPVGRTADSAVVQAARTSTGQGLKTPAEDRTILRYLYRNEHGTPFEMVNFKFHHVLPIFVARQLIRARTASVNEYSLRYSEAKDRFWFPPSPDYLRKQGVNNKQGGIEPMDLADAEGFIADLHVASATAMTQYEEARRDGLSRELARVILPVNLMTEWYWELDCRNLLKLLSLRMDHHAQAEIRVYADAMYELIKPLVPVTIEAFDDYDVRRGGLLLSRMDLDGMNPRNREHMSSLFPSDRELTEFKEKMWRLDKMDAARAAADLLADRGEAKKQV